MKTEQQLRDEIKALEDQKKPLQDQLNEISNKRVQEIEGKIQRCTMMLDKFTPEELVFAATSRCCCGAGLAYPKDTGIKGSWDCSAILTGTAEKGSTHDASYPFAFFSILSEEQKTRTGGATTRPQ